MSSAQRARLDRECRVFCHYMMQQEPNAYVLGKYAEGNVTLGLQARPADFFERALLGIAGAHPILARMTDAYTRLLKPRSRLRSKLVLLLAIVETCSPTEQRFRTSRARSATVVFLLLLLHGVGFMAVLAVGVIVLAPLQLGAAAVGRPGPRDRSKPFTALERS